MQQIYSLIESLKFLWPQHDCTMKSYVLFSYAKVDQLNGADNSYKTNGLKSSGAILPNSADTLQTYMHPMK